MNMRMLSAAGLLAVCGVAGADTAVLQAVADNTLYESAFGETSNGLGEYVFTGDTGSFGVRRTVLRFDLAAGVPAGATISSVTLTMVMDRTRSGPDDVNMHRVTASWGEGTSNAGFPGGAGTDSTTGDATWLHRSYPSVNWATVGGDFAGASSSVTSVNIEGTYTWPSTASLVADAQSMLDSPATNFGWVLIGSETGVRSAKRYASRESLDPGSRPVLTVTFTAPPSCAGDTNGDGHTNGADLSVLLGQFNSSVTPGTGADLNGDGQVNGADLSVMLADFGC